MTVRILDGERFDAEVEARAVRAAATAEAERVRGELTVARAAAERDLARARAEADAARAEAARVRELAGLPAAGGHVTALTGLTIRARCPGVTVGELVTIARTGWGEPRPPLPAEVVGFTDDDVVLMPLGELAGVGPGAAVIATGGPLTFPCGLALLGRVIDALGQPLDGDAIDAPPWPIERAAPSAIARPAITAPLVTGVRAIDGLCTLGRGQRLGLFAAAGVGKSTLLAQIAGAADADVIVLGLVGERGRELGDWLERLGPARARTVVVCAGSDAPSLARVRAAFTATAVAEYFRDRGDRVLLLVDSLTRVARAQREVGLSAGEPPARHGYPPSVFALLPRLCERAGTAPVGDITAIYTVLVAGNDLDEPIADEVRSIVDGHLVLDRRLAGRGHFPPIDVVASVSRLFPTLASRAQQDAAAVVRRHLAIHDEHRDLLAVGAYRPGGDRALDLAVQRMPAIEAYLRQDRAADGGLRATVDALVTLAAAR